MSEYKSIVSKNESASDTFPHPNSIGIYKGNKIAFGSCLQSDTIDIFEWNHIVAVYENGNKKLYVNNIELCNSVVDSIESNSSVIFVGKSYDVSLDEFRIYDEAIDEAEVNILYRQFKATSSIKENQLQSLQVFPNPVSDELTLNLSEDAFAIELISDQGRSVKTIHDIPNKVFSLSIRELNSGTYTLVVKNRNGLFIASKRIVVQR